MEERLPSGAPVERGVSGSLAAQTPVRGKAWSSRSRCTQTTAVRRFPRFRGTPIEGAARSVLKMERVDPGPGAGFRDARGLSMATASRAGRTSAHRSGLLPSTDQVSRFRGAIHLQGSTPDRSVQGGDRFTSERHVTAPMRGKHDHMPYRPRRDGRRTNGWREQVQQHQVLAPGQQGLRRASGAPGDERQQAAELNSTNGSHGHRL